VYHGHILTLTRTRLQILLNDTMPHTYYNCEKHYQVKSSAFLIHSKDGNGCVSKRSDNRKHDPAIQPKITPLHTTHEKHPIAFRPGINSYWFFSFSYMTSIHIYNEVPATAKCIPCHFHISEPDLGGCCHL
jgi:hypothetical protein